MASSAQAFACSFIQKAPLPDDLKALIKKERQAQKIKSNIEVAVWGAFLGHQPEQSKAPKVLSFYVGGKLKGDVPDRIKIKTDKGSLISGGTVYYMNLKKIDDDIWTDMNVPQDHLNWDEVACSLDPNGARCTIYQTQHSEIKESCIAYIRKAAWYCAYGETLPRACIQYKDEALRHNPW